MYDAACVVWPCDDGYHAVHCTETQDAQTNMSPMTPTQLCDRNEMVRRRKGGDAPDEKLGKCGGSLDEGQMEWLDIKLEEESRDTRMQFELWFVVCNTILICL